MKKLLSFSLIALFSVSLMAQNRAQINPALKNYSVKSPVHPQKEMIPVNTTLALPHSKAFAEEEMGNSFYDLQTNRSSYNRLHLYADGTLGAVWTFAGTSTYSDRGTGYNYFDGTAWAPSMPTARIESIRTGFPSYSPLGTGEVVIAHSATQLYMSKRDNKGTGAWTGMAIPFNLGTEPTWPRVCVNGNTIHAICVDYTSAKLLYFRSLDGGTTWDKQGEEITGLTSVEYPNGFDADGYDWALPKNGTLAFLIGDKASDLVMMKSIDDGNTWTKTVIFQHPYPGFVESTTLVTDTPTVCDGAHSIVLDNSGSAYVAFGTCGFLNDDITDGGYNFFSLYYNYCVGFWKEGMPMLTSVNPADLDLTCQAIGWALDVDGSGTIFDAAGDFGDYQLGITTAPQLTIGDDNNLYVIYVSPNEAIQLSGTGQYYNHVWGRSSTTNGDTWTDFVEITGGQDHDQVECVYPSMATNTDGKVHFIYMMDYEPGNALNNDADPVAYNSIYYVTFDFTDFSSTEIPCTVGMNEVNMSGSINVYPNPVSDFVSVDFNTLKSANVTMEFYNSVGSLVKSESFVAEKGTSKQVSMKELASGIYLVKMVTPQGTITKKITKN